MTNPQNPDTPPPTSSPPSSPANGSPAATEDQAVPADTATPATPAGTAVVVTAEQAAQILRPAQVLAEQDAGRAAALADQHVSTCPHVPATDRLSAARALMWLTGYALGRTELRAQRARPARPQHGW